MIKPIVGIVMGSDSDLEVMKEAAKMLEDFGIKYEITVLSAHRMPKDVSKYAHTAQKKGLKMLIAGAGGAAHLAGVLAGLTTFPVIGVPIKSKNLDGLDSLLSTAQMPPGVPVATVAINGAKNAGILAAQILSISDLNLGRKLAAYKSRMRKDINLKGKELSRIGYKKYLKSK